MSAETLVLNLLTGANKPFGLQGICDMLATKGVKKAQAQKALDALAGESKIIAKVCCVVASPQHGLTVYTHP